MATSTTRGLLALAALGHVVVTALVWRDIGGRSSSELRGSRTFWRLLTAANTANGVVYLLWGRRPLGQVATPRADGPPAAPLA